MSKVVKGIKKGIKKVGKVIKKAAPYILMAAAVYFTAGVALSYFPATAAFSAAMPGFGAAGIFTKTATAIGLAGPASAAAASSLSAAGGTIAAGGISGMMSGASVAQAATGLSAAGYSSSAASLAAAAKAGGQAAARSAQSQVASTLSSSKGGTTTFGSSAGSKAGSQAGKSLITEGVKQGTQEATKKGFFGNMSVGEKLLLAKTVTDTASGLFAKEPRDPNKYFWGYSRKGEGMDMLSGDPRSAPTRGYRDPQHYYDQGTPEFMPENMNVASTTPADRQMEEYQTRERDTRDREDDEDFI